MSITTPHFASQIRSIWQQLFEGAKETPPKSGQELRDAASPPSSNSDSYVKWLPLAAFSVPLAAGVFLWRDVNAQLSAAQATGEAHGPDAAAQEAKLAESLRQLQLMKESIESAGAQGGSEAPVTLEYLEKRAATALELFSITRGTEIEVEDGKAAASALQDYSNALVDSVTITTPKGERRLRDVFEGNTAETLLTAAETKETALRLWNMASKTRDPDISATILMDVARLYEVVGKPDLARAARIEVVKFDSSDTRPVEIVNRYVYLMDMVSTAQSLFLPKPVMAFGPRLTLSPRFHPEVLADRVSPFTDEALRAAAPELRVVMLAQNLITTMVEKAGKNPSREALHAATASAYEEALATWDRVSELQDPVFMAELLFRAGNWYQSAGETDLAYKAYRRITRPFPQDGRGTVEINFGRYKNLATLASFQVGWIEKDALSGFRELRDDMRGALGYTFDPKAQLEFGARWMEVAFKVFDISGDSTDGAEVYDAMSRVARGIESLIPRKASDRVPAASFIEVEEQAADTKAKLDLLWRKTLVLGKLSAPTHQELFELVQTKLQIFALRSDSVTARDVMWALDAYAKALQGSEDHGSQEVAAALKSAAELRETIVSTVLSDPRLVYLSSGDESSELARKALHSPLAARELLREGDGRLPEEVKAALPRADAQVLEGRTDGAEEAAAELARPRGARGAVGEVMKGKVK